MRNTPVSEIMTKNPILLKPGTPVDEAADIFTKNNIGGAPVVDDNGRLAGIVTETDLLMQDVRLHFPTSIQLLAGTIYLESMKKFEDQLKKAVAAKVEDVMTRDVVTVKEYDTVETVATLMVEKDIGRIPVLSHDGKVSGIVAKKDLVKAISEHI